LPGRHYVISPQSRLPESRRLIEQDRYFVVYGPPRSGKTTTLLALAQELAAHGRHVVLHFSCEQAEAAGDDYGAAEVKLLEAIRLAADNWLPAEYQPPVPWPDARPGSRVSNALSDWAGKRPLPIVLFFDDFDVLRGRSRTSVLSQLRDGYTYRPNAFPASVVLCGTHDVRDYRVASGRDADQFQAGTPFNVKAASLLIADFTREQVTELYGQYTTQTGQEFLPEALDLAWECSQGQPWLSNALGREIINGIGIPPADPITTEHVEAAKERLILARETHLGTIISRLNEPRVRRLIEPLIAGDLVATDATAKDDLSYARDLGLVAPTDPVAIANPVYKEIIVRELGVGRQRPKCLPDSGSRPM
jgi:DNA polymerase III delta prime subunit